MMKVGITGGIGSGKSTVCRLFARLGVAVYDSDREAKRLMAEDAALRGGIVGRFGAGSYADGVLNRGYLAARVFSDPEALAALNALVHPAVLADLRRGPDGCRIGSARPAHRTHMPPRRLRRRCGPPADCGAGG